MLSASLTYTRSCFRAAHVYWIGNTSDLGIAVNAAGLTKGRRRETTQTTSIPMRPFVKSELPSELLFYVPPISIATASYQTIQFKRLVNVPQ